MTIRAHEKFMQSLTAERAEAAFNQEEAIRKKNMNETKYDLMKQMKDHRRNQKI